MDKLRVAFQRFYSFTAAAEFASKILPDRLISISQSRLISDLSAMPLMKLEITVWYWEPTDILDG